MKTRCALKYCLFLINLKHKALNKNTCHLIHILIINISGLLSFEKISQNVS